MTPSSCPVGSGGARYGLGVARWSLVVLLAFELVICTFVMRLPPYAYADGWGVVLAPYSPSVQGREVYGVLRYLENGEIKTPYTGRGISIVVLGDSTVQAAQVNNDDNFVSLTESTLRARGVEAHLHNLGGSERAIADHVYAAPAIHAAYQPDCVIGLASFLEDILK